MLSISRARPAEPETGSELKISHRFTANFGLYISSDWHLIEIRLPTKLLNSYRIHRLMTLCLDLPPLSVAVDGSGFVEEHRIVQ
jgi:hypothetical protein